MKFPHALFLALLLCATTTGKLLADDTNTTNSPDNFNNVCPVEEPLFPEVCLAPETLSTPPENNMSLVEPLPFSTCSQDQGKSDSHAFFPFVTSPEKSMPTSMDTYLNYSQDKSIKNDVEQCFTITSQTTNSEKDFLDLLESCSKQAHNKLNKKKEKAILLTQEYGEYLVYLSNYPDSMQYDDHTFAIKYNWIENEREQLEHLKSEIKNQEKITQKFGIMHEGISEKYAALNDILEKSAWDTSVCKHKAAYALEEYTKKETLSEGTEKYNKNSDALIESIISMSNKICSDHEEKLLNAQNEKNIESKRVINLYNEIIKNSGNNLKSLCNNILLKYNNIISVFNYPHKNKLLREKAQAEFKNLKDFQKNNTPEDSYYKEPIFCISASKKDVSTELWRKNSQNVKSGEITFKDAWEENFAQACNLNAGEGCLPKKSGDHCSEEK